MDQQPASFSLYIDLFENSAADLEIVAKAALSLSAALREAAFVLDPGLDFRIEFVSGTRSSLSLNSVFRLLGKDDAQRRERLIWLSIVAASWFGGHVSDKAFDFAWDQALGSDVSITEEDKQEIANKVLEGLRNKAAQEHVQKVYRELDRDPAVRGVGASLIPGAKPTYIVPRSEFPERSETVVLPEAITEKKRTRKAKEKVVLMSPFLATGDRRWKLKGVEGEFGASIKDIGFLNRMLSGRVAIPMVRGIVLDVEMDIHEDFTGGVWVPGEREVTKIRKVIPPGAQGQLALPPPKRKPRPKAKKNKK